MLRTASYLSISAVVFAGVAVAQLLRAFNTLPLTFGNWPVPVWLAALVTATLSAWAFALLRRRD